jgi:hypothetical protein
MPIPSVDVVTGIVTNGPIEVGEAFRWTCSEFAANITVTAQPAPWFTPNPALFTRSRRECYRDCCVSEPGRRRVELDR